MKKNLLFITGFILVLLMACKKDPIPTKPIDPPPVDTTTLRSYRFVFTNLPGQQVPIHGLSAVVTVLNDRNEKVLDNKYITIPYDGKYSSEEMKLVKGNYTITKMIIVKSDSTALFATPIRGSNKAAMVGNPLSVPFTLNEKLVKELTTDLLAIGTQDKATDFGYPEGSFGKGGNDEQPIHDLSIIVHPMIKVGNIIYDSIPVTLVLRSYFANNNVDYRPMPLSAGKHAILLPKDAVRYELSVSKWGTTDQIVLMKNDVVENSVYTIGGEATAKKIKNVITSKIINGVSKPESKADYEYHADGKLKQIIYYGKRDDMSTYQSGKEEFDYTNGQISETRVFNEFGALKSTTKFQYNNEGKVIKMEEVDGAVRTTADVGYVALEGETGISKDHRIGITYNSTSYYYTMTFNKMVHGGVVINDVLATTHGDYQEGYYNYDFNINPYAILEIPNMLFSNYSKHNLVAQSRTYANAFPSVIPYDFSYSYNDNGFAKESLVKYKSYFTQAEAYTIRTVFEYF